MPFSVTHEATIQIDGFEHPGCRQNLHRQLLETIRAARSNPDAFDPAVLLPTIFTAPLRISQISNLPL